MSGREFELTKGKFASLSGEKRSLVLGVMEGIAARRVNSLEEYIALAPETRDGLALKAPEVEQLLDQMVNKAAAMHGGLERVQACIERVRASSTSSEKQR